MRKTAFHDLNIPSFCVRNKNVNFQSIQMKLEFLFSPVAGILSGGVSPRPGGGSSNGEVSIVEAQGGSGDTWYKMKLFIRQPWFIGTMGAVAWIILMIVVLLLHRQRRNKRKSQKALATRGDFLVVFSVTCNMVRFHTVLHTSKTNPRRV